MDWYFTIGTEKKGPVDLQEVKRLISRGVLNNSDFVWNATMGEQWKPISEVPILSSHAISTTQQMSSNTVIDGKPSSAHFERRTKIIKILVVIAIIIAAVIIFKRMS